MHRKDMVLLLFIDGYETFLVSIYWKAYRFTESRIHLLLILMGIFLWITNILIIYLYQMKQKRFTINKRCTDLLRQIGTAEKYIQPNEAYVVEFNQMKQLYLERIKSVREAVMEAEDADQIETILDQSMSYDAEGLLTTYHMNPIINTILVTKKKEAANQGIAMSIHVTCTKDVMVEELDLCSLFCNLLDNAIESCSKLPDGNPDKNIGVQIWTRADILFLKVKNGAVKVPSDLGKKRITSKRDKENHGFGIQIIWDVVKKYEGDFRISASENMVTSLAYVNMRGNKCDNG